jgi:hypothetical protein
MTANPPGTVALGSYDKVYLMMRVRNVACPPGQTWNSNNPDPVACAAGGTNSSDLALRTDDPATSYYLFVNGVQEPQGATVSLMSLMQCGQTFHYAWEDGGNFSVQDFYFDVSADCTSTLTPSSPVR